MPSLPQATAISTRRQSDSTPAPLAGLPRVHSHDLFRDGHLVLIEHGGEHYYLRMTRNNKLILTK